MTACKTDTARRAGKTVRQLHALVDSGNANAISALYWAYVNAAEVMQGFLNQPRTIDAAADRLEDEMEDLIDKAAEVAEILCGMKPSTDEHDRLARSHVLSDWAHRDGTVTGRESKAA